MTQQTAFWDKVAPKYRQQPISDTAAYDQTIERVVSYLKPDDTVLELGCGTGGTALRLAPHAGSILATDFAPGMIAQAKARKGADNVTFQACGVFDPSLKPGSFDVIMGFNLFHLVPDTPKAYAQVHDLLAPGGLFISKSPCLAEPRLGLKFGTLRLLIPVMQLLGKAPFVRYMSITGVEAEISGAGFRIVETGNYPNRPPNHFVVAEKL